MGNMERVAWKTYSDLGFVCLLTPAKFLYKCYLPSVTSLAYDQLQLYC